jgi:hypothetical protein
MRTQQEITRQIEGILEEKSRLPQYSHFGDLNHEIADAQISILDGSCTLEDIDEGDWDEMDNQNKVYRGAEQADEWLQGDDDEDLFG